MQILMSQFRRRPKTYLYDITTSNIGFRYVDILKINYCCTFQYSQEIAIFTVIITIINVIELYYFTIIIIKLLSVNFMT
jgi:hypothetical protein